MAFEKPAIVIDNGSHILKAGFTCDNHPVSMFRTLVGRPDNVQDYNNQFYDVYVGNEVIARIDDLLLSKPVVRSVIVDWDDMERIWHHVYYKELRVAPEDRAVIMGVSSKSTIEQRMQYFETFFETLNAPALCIQSQSVLGMYGSGLTTGICVDMGHDTTDVVPVYEGGIIKYAQIETGIAGRQVSEYMRRCLHACCNDLKSATDMETLKRTCYVTENCAMPIRDYTRKYKLPSGDEIDVSNECFMAAEMIFQPDLVMGEKTAHIPLHEAVFRAALKCDPDLRSQLYNSIVLCGGLAMVNGTAKRLNCEIKNIVDDSIQILTSSESYATPWLGGAVFGGLEGAKEMWIEKEQYEEFGFRIVKNKITF